ncbi:hypothetical protein [Nocardia beijingensis]|uniref:hypothetical protein n=1 Tax=Nocardia beijingensis TaxID=95162 RepID=UPI000AFF19F7|nr:hypothetical protein [Nocardia beijingensis]
MRQNPPSMFGVVAALDGRNIRAHRAGTIEDCALCTTVSIPSGSCPAGRAAALTHAAARPLTAVEILEQLHASGSMAAW